MVDEEGGKEVVEEEEEAKEEEDAPQMIEGGQSAPRALSPPELLSCSVRRCRCLIHRFMDPLLP